MCSSKPPKADPLIGQAAMSNAELAKEQSAVAREQLQGKGQGRKTRPAY